MVNIERSEDLKKTIIIWASVCFVLIGFCIFTSPFAIAQQGEFQPPEEKAETPTIEAEKSMERAAKQAEEIISPLPPDINWAVRAFPLMESTPEKIKKDIPPARATSLYSEFMLPEDVSDIVKTQTKEILTFKEAEQEVYRTILEPTINVTYKFDVEKDGSIDLTMQRIKPVFEEGISPYENYELKIMVVDKEGASKTFNVTPKGGMEEIVVGKGDEVSISYQKGGVLKKPEWEWTRSEEFQPQETEKAPAEIEEGEEVSDRTVIKEEESIKKIEEVKPRQTEAIIEGKEALIPIILTPTASGLGKEIALETNAAARTLDLDLKDVTGLLSSGLVGSGNKVADFIKAQWGKLKDKIIGEKPDVSEPSAGEPAVEDSLKAAEEIRRPPKTEEKSMVKLDVPQPDIQFLAAENRILLSGLNDDNKVYSAGDAINIEFGGSKASPLPSEIKGVTDTGPVLAENDFIVNLTTGGEFVVFLESPEGELIAFRLAVENKKDGIKNIFERKTGEEKNIDDVILDLDDELRITISYLLLKGESQGFPDWRIIFVKGVEDTGNLITFGKQEKQFSIFGERESDTLRIEGLLKCLVREDKIKYVLINTQGEKIALFGPKECGLSPLMADKFVVVRGIFVGYSESIPKDFLIEGVNYDSYIIVESVQLMGEAYGGIAVSSRSLTKARK